MKIIPYLTFISALAIIPLYAQSVSPTPAESAPATKAAKAIKASSFRGTVSAVDPTASTFTIANKDNTKVRVFLIGATTKVTRAGQDIPAGEIKVGDYARGSGVKLEPNKIEVASVQVGEKTTEEIAADQKKKEAKKAAAGN